MKKLKVFRYIAVGLGFLLGYSIYIICSWISDNFGAGMDEIIFTLTSPLKGSDNSAVLAAAKYCVPRMVIVVLAYALYAFVDSKIRKKVTLSLKIKKILLKFDLIKLSRRAVAVLSVFSIVISVLYVNNQFKVTEYITNQNSYTAIYDEYYVEPRGANIALANKDGEYKNLIYIYLESMETTYTSVENGGKQDICYIPKLVELANDNISFSNSDKIGGFTSVTGSSYTMGALMATTSGVPFSFPIALNGMSTRETFASGLTAIGDILEGFGYNQEFLCGSDGAFAGRKNYFTQHGNYKMFDLFTAREKGYIPEDYYVFWGYEDKYLYEIAKDELTSLAQKDEPFNFTMLTVDTHHISGYVCSLCGNDYDMQVKNVVSCADKQISEFIEWCKKQSFYEDTVIIISGDHPRMDTDMVEGVEYNDRTVYNCFLNCESGDVRMKNRVFTPMDMFPTTLYALGFSWDGNRLGLGTNLFSKEQTLAEEIGLDYLNSELSKKSKYYINNFY